MRYVNGLVLSVLALSLGGCFSGVDQYYTPNNNSAILSCGSSAVVVETGKARTVTFSYNLDEAPSSLQFTLKSEPVVEDMGAINQTGAFTAIYQAPAASDEELFVTATASTGGMAGAVATCKIRVPPTGGFVDDDGETQGLVGKVYDIADDPSPTVLPVDYSIFDVESTIVVPNFDVPDRRFELGFPGLPGLFEWFAIVFEGQITFPQAATYHFKVVSDDGSKLFINDNLIVNNDGTHAPRARCGLTSSTNPTGHAFGAQRLPVRMEYFQGPRVQIALEMFWATTNPGTCSSTNHTGWEKVPPEAFDRPL